MLFFTIFLAITEALEVNMEITKNSDASTNLFYKETSMIVPRIYQRQ